MCSGKKDVIEMYMTDNIILYSSNTSLYCFYVHIFISCSLVQYELFRLLKQSFNECLAMMAEGQMFSHTYTTYKRIKIQNRSVFFKAEKKVVLKLKPHFGKNENLCILLSQRDSLLLNGFRHTNECLGKKVYSPSRTSQ